MAPQDREEEIVVRLARFGFDTVGGYLREPEQVFLRMIDQLDRGSRLTVAQLVAALAGDRPPVVLDVRNSGERSSGAIDGSLHIPLAELSRRSTEVPTDRPVVVHCAGLTAPRWLPACCAPTVIRTSPTCSAATRRGEPPRRRPKSSERCGVV
ncbi:hypothetical protein O7632_16055 [Solwaraspora sp. WMMD406]|uniref:rhodanese-like domain-containing protein n=1 Tax=Solwaraspora sp. WMMD406 TaxID=3016095 RepID=UPI00241674FF|nr:rhodanese-like domain-containing protein [Solwaraspora sp. WMMD406]MDG4765599.1 hypothetical protein [Solwaraspora sp. WMMD406]